MSACRPGSVGVVTVEVVDWREHPAAAYLRNVQFAGCMTDNERAALEQRGVVLPVFTEAYRARLERALQPKARWDLEEPSWR